MIARLVREPLVHFLLIGALLFLLFMALGGSGGSGRRVTVDDAMAAQLVGRFEATWKRAPTAEEFRVLVESHVRDEILYREGLKLGLDRDDPLVKRRVRQKIEVIAEENSGAPPATEADLEAWLAAHAHRYSEPAVVTFEQVMVDPAKHGASTGASLEKIRSALLAGADPSTLGDSQMLPVRVDSLAVDLVARDFGDGFATALTTMKIGGWEGPLRSGFGVHFVRLEQRVVGRLPTLDEIRAAVARDLEADRRAKASDAYYRNLRKHYDVIVASKLPSAPKP